MQWSLKFENNHWVKLVVSRDTYLAVLCQGLKCLVNQSHIILIDVESKESQATSSGSTNTVQEHESFWHKVVISFIVLISQQILKR